MTAGQTYDVSVTMKNTGGTTWTEESEYRIGSQNPQNNWNWGISRVHIDSGETIFPDQEKTFVFTITAPSTSGIYNFQWRMVQDSVEWFGDYTENVEVGAEESPYVPSGYSLSVASPSSEKATIKYGMPRAGQVTLKVYNVNGQFVRTLVNEVQKPRNYTLTWNGKDNSGKEVSTGTYFCKLETGTFRSTEKLQLIRE